LALQTLQTINNDLVNYVLTPVSPAGDLIPDADGDTFIIAENTSGANDIIVTATALKACDQGEIHTKQFTVPLTDKVIIPLNSRFNNASGQVAITYDNSRTTAATGVVTFSGSVSDGDIVTIGTRVYEFDTAANPGAITAGRVRVDVSGGATASAAVTALALAITNDASAVVTGVDGTGDTVDITAKTTYSGAAGNAIVFTKTGTNIAVSGSGTLTNGADVLSIACLRNTR
jgi:hypothetical protein